MNWDDVWGILKWVLAALVAGFLGQFGKSLALHLMRRRRAHQSKQELPTADQSTPKGSSQPGVTAASDINELAKIEKKRAKAEVKRLKKS